jgi:hypothetical protein
LSEWRHAWPASESVTISSSRRALPFLQPSVVAAVGGGLTVIRPFCRETCEGVPRDRSGTPRQSGCSTLNLAVSACSSKNLVLPSDEESIRHQKDGAGLPWCWPHAPAAMRGPLSADSMLRQQQRQQQLTRRRRHRSRCC